MKTSLLRTDHNHLIERRALECVGLTLIGDGVLAFVEPQGHIALWRKGPEPWQKMMEPFAKHPLLTRWLGAAEFALGFWRAKRQQPHV